MSSTDAGATRSTREARDLHGIFTETETSSTVDTVVVLVDSSILVRMLGGYALP